MDMSDKMSDMHEAYDNNELSTMAYRQGFIDGLEAYAHWRDGKQHVGTTGKTLKDAIANVENTWNFSPPRGQA